jgi:hypothetical protein
VARWQSEYEKCRQLDSDTVQSYCERYQRLCSQLGIADDDEQAINKFVKRLKPQMLEAYYTHVTTLKATAKAAGDVQAARLDATLRSLTEVMDICTELDVSSRTVALIVAEAGNERRGPASSGGAAPHDGSSALRRSRSRQRSGGAVGGAAGSRPGASPHSSRAASAPRSGGGKTLHCKFHPNSTNHSTADCRFGNRVSGGATKPSTGGGSLTTPAPAGGAPNRSTASTSNANVTCYKCGAKGHYANECPARSGDRPSGGSAAPSGSGAPGNGVGGKRQRSLKRKVSFASGASAGNSSNEEKKTGSAPDE